MFWHDDFAYFNIMRIGPSASEVPVTDDMEGLVKSLSHIQHLMQNEKMRDVIGALAPQLLVAFPEPEGKKDVVKAPSTELENARDGLPASSKPAPSKRLSKPAFTPEPDSAPALNEVEKKPPADPTPSPTSVAPETSDPSINSSTHRAAHARLNRRMSSIDPAKFPHMCKLWSGNRKDRFFFGKNQPIKNHILMVASLHRVMFILNLKVFKSKTTCPGQAGATQTVCSTW